MTGSVTTSPSAAEQGQKAKRARAPRRPKLADRATAYAQRVLAGEIIAGPHVRNACARHLRDLSEGPARGLVWSVEHAAEAIAFFEEVLCLNGGQFEGKPFLLDHWQAFVVGSLNGWLRYDEKHGRHLRRFRVAYIETGKGSGKSPLAAGIGMKGLTAEGELRAEVYAAATKRDQAMVMFRDAVAMWQHSPELNKRLVASGVGEGIWNLAYRATGSWFRTISADDGQSGPRPHIALVDEVHEHKTGSVVEMLRAGFKWRAQPLLLMITNSGSGKTTPCWAYHEYAVEVAAGRALNDEHFSLVCGLDDGDDPLLDESCWPKANPSLQFVGLPGAKYLREQVAEAIGMPAKEALVRRLSFCQWTEAINPWLSAHVWDPCRKEFDADQLRGRRAYAGLDLSSTTDLTGLVLLVEPKTQDEPWLILPYCWLPEDGLAERCRRDRVDYRTWVAQGHLETTPGRAISKRHVLQRLVQIGEQFEIVSIAYDRWRMADFIQIAQDEGATLPPLIAFGQGFRDMGPAVDAFETAILNRTVAHNGHPVLAMCAANAVTTTDPAGSRKLDKAKANGRIDLIVAAVMAHFGVVRTEVQERSFWDRDDSE